MNRHLHEPANALLYRALDLPAKQRQPFIADACAGAPELLELVRTLLMRIEQIDEFIDAADPEGFLSTAALQDNAPAHADAWTMPQPVSPAAYRDRDGAPLHESTPAYPDLPGAAVDAELPSTPAQAELAGTSLLENVPADVDVAAATAQPELPGAPADTELPSTPLHTGASAPSTDQHLDSASVRAGLPSGPEPAQARTLWQRHRAGLVVAALVACTLLAGIAATMWRG